MNGSGGEGRSPALHESSSTLFIRDQRSSVRRYGLHSDAEVTSAGTPDLSVSFSDFSHHNGITFTTVCVCVLFKGSVPQQCWLQCRARLFITNTRSVPHQISHSPLNALMKTYWTRHSVSINAAAFRSLWSLQEKRRLISSEFHLFCYEPSRPPPVAPLSRLHHVVELLTGTVRRRAAGVRAARGERGLMLHVLHVTRGKHGVARRGERVHTKMNISYSITL